MAANHFRRKRFILNPGSTVLDLGAAPGGWSKYAAKNIQSEGLLVAVDLLPLDDKTVSAIEKDPDGPLFHIIQGDFTTNEVKEELIDLIDTYGEEHERRGVDCIISDMAANFTGDKMTDALRTMNLCEDALMLAAGRSCFDERYIAGTDENEDGILRKGGSFLCKFFSCGQENEKDLKDATKRHFKQSTVLKPKASRKESAEMYLLAIDYKGGKK